MGSKKKQTTTTNQTQTAAPPAWTLPGFEIAGKAVTDALAGPRVAPYAGDFVAGMDPARLAAQIAAYDAASGTVGELGGFADAQLRDLFAPRDSQALLQEAIKASIEPTFRQLREQTLPGIRNSALASGAYTNDRALGVVPENAIRNATESAQRIGAELGYQGFQAEEDRRLDRAGMLPGLANLVAQMTSARGDLLGMGTQLEQGNRQAGLDNAIARHDYAVGAPYESISPAAQLLALLSGNYGTQTSDGKQTTVQKTSGLGPILQGALGVASAAAGLGAFGPLGTAAGILPGGAAAAPAISSLPEIIKKMTASAMFNPQTVFHRGG